MVTIPAGWDWVSAHTQDEADERIPLLLQSDSPVRVVRITGQVDLSRWLGIYTCYGCRYRGFDSSDVEGNPNAYACPECGTENGDGFGEAENDPDCRDKPRLNWVIVSGGSEPLHPDWVRSIRDQCQAAGVPFYFEGWGEYEVYDNRVHGLTESPGATRVGGRELVSLTYGPGRYAPQTLMIRTGRDAAGRVLDGRTWDEIPGEVARVN